MSQWTTETVDYGQLFHRAPAGYIVAGTDGTILAANATMCAWTGVADGGLDGTRLLDLMPAGDRLMYRTHAGPKLERDGHLGELSSNCWGRTGSAGRSCSLSPAPWTAPSRGT
ncbi:PAS domain S-box protein [Arthrobacter sp. OVS8]|nr:PAS domain S-box protein [Arthrobacter sp. OVS8]